MKQGIKPFLEELLGFVHVLDDVQEGPDIQPYLLKIAAKYADIDNKGQLWHSLDDLCGDIPETYLMLLEYLYAAVKDEEILEKQLSLLKEGLQNDTLDLFYANYYKWQITHRLFTTFNSKNFYCERSDLHKALINKMEKFIDLQLPFIEENKRNKDRIVVAIAQFLGIKHGPTRNALDYCYTLQSKLKKEVFLFIANELPVTSNSEYENYGIQYTYFNYLEKYDGYFTLEYRGVTIKGYQCKINSGNKKQIREVLLNVYEWNPGLVYNIGSENMVIDLCSRFTKEVTIPLGNIYPITDGPYLIVPRKIEKGDKEIINYISKNNQRVIESIFVYKLEEPIKKYLKSDFGIEEQAFVIAIVGTRLEAEIDDEFIRILHQILESDPTIFIVFMGNFPDYEDAQVKIGYQDRVKYIGHQSDVRGVMNIAQLYLNPPRRGGGTSSVEALAEGVPVITLPKCDVAYSCGEDFYCASTKDMLKLIQRYMQDDEFYRVQKEKAYRQAERVVDTEAVLKNIIDIVGI